VGLIIKLLKPVILTKGKFAKNRITISYNSKKHSRGKLEKEFINSKWENQKRKKGLLFNGKMFGVGSYAITKNAIRLTLFQTTYKEYVGTRSSQFVKKFGIQNIANPLSIGCILETLDDKVVIVKRSSNVDTSKGKFSIPSGWLSPSHDIKNGKIDVFCALKREIKEEIHLDEKHVGSLVCLGLVFNSKFYQTFMPFFAKLNVDSELLNKNSKNFEIQRIVFMPKRNLTRLNKSPSSDILAPTIKLYHNMISRRSP
jgi:hypothetical protein